MKSVSAPDGSLSSSTCGVPVVPLGAAPRAQSRLPSWSPSSLYCDDDLPGVPLDCFTAAMIDDGSDPSWVPYDHYGLDPVVYVEEPESPSGSEEEPEEMEVDQD